MDFFHFVNREKEFFFEYYPKKRNTTGKGAGNPQEKN